MMETQLGAPFLVRSAPLIVTLRHSFITVLMRIWGKHADHGEI